MFKQLKRDLIDKKIIEASVIQKENRKKYIIEKRLGLKATSLSEVKVLLSGKLDKFADTFAKLEILEKDILDLNAEKKIIEDGLEEINKIIAKSKDIELKVFKCRYISGLTQLETAEVLNYSIDRIKQIDKKIKQKK